MLRNLPLILLGLFWLVDIFAPWLGMRQVSVQVWDAGWAARIASAAVLIVLASHLALQWPLGPSGG